MNREREGPYLDSFLHGLLSLLRGQSLVGTHVDDNLVKNGPADSNLDCKRAALFDDAPVIFLEDFQLGYESIPLLVVLLVYFEQQDHKPVEDVLVLLAGLNGLRSRFLQDRDQGLLVGENLSHLVVDLLLLLVAISRGRSAALMMARSWAERLRTPSTTLLLSLPFSKTDMVTES